jgi:hypothetical protein
MPSKRQCFVAISKHSATTAHKGHYRDYAFPFAKGVDAVADEYSLSDVLERIYQNQLGLEAALMELTLHVEQQGFTEVGDNVRGASWAIGENAGYVKQGLAKLKGKSGS